MAPSLPNIAVMFMYLSLFVAFPNLCGTTHNKNISIRNFDLTCQVLADLLPNNSFHRLF